MKYMLSHPETMLILARQHIQLTTVSAMLAILIGVPMGILIYRFKVLAVPVLTVAGLMYLVPSLALFAVLIPLLGLGSKSAIVALVMYSLLVINRNTYTGLDIVQQDLREAAKGIGMSELQQLSLVELPMALPVIIGGIRIAVVMNIGIASIAAYIGAGGFGKLIFRGISTVDNDLIIAGAIPIVILAIVADWLLRRVESLLQS